MSVKQLSVFIENKKGSLSYVTSLLAENGIDLKAMSMADTKEYGIMRVIVDDVDKALDVLRGAGQTASVREVCSFAVPDRTGGLSEVLDILNRNDINVEYMYSYVNSAAGKAYMVTRTDDFDRAEKVLLENGVELI